LAEKYTDRRLIKYFRSISSCIYPTWILSAIQNHREIRDTIFSLPKNKITSKAMAEYHYGIK